MNPDQLHWLQSPEAGQWLNRLKGLSGPEAVLLARKQVPPDRAAALATQLELRNNLAAKLPTWVRAGALFERDVAEQASSEEAATYTASRLVWPRVLDATAGLGIDAWAMNRTGATVLALEADALRASLLRHNLPLLGAQVDVRCSRMEDWLATNPVPEAAYADPARRDAQNTKRIALPQLLPNPLPLWHSSAQQVLLKLSPLFDATEAERSLPGLTHLHVLSRRGEVKMLLAERRGPAVPLPHPPVRVAVGLGATQCWRFSGRPEAPTRLGNDAGLLGVPDAALAKANLVGTWANQHGAAQTHPQGFVLLPQACTDFPGRVVQVLHSARFKPHDWKRRLRQMGVGQAQVVLRQFAGSVAQVRRQLGLAENGRHLLLVGNSPEGHWAWLGTLLPEPDTD